VIEIHRLVVVFENGAVERHQVDAVAVRTVRLLQHGPGPVADPLAARLAEAIRREIQAECAGKDWHF
jgi:hypothetical protein